MSLRDGREGGGVPDAVQGGVFLSPSETWKVWVGTTGIGLEDKNDTNRIFPSLLQSTRSAWSLLSFIFLPKVLRCSSWISRSVVDPLATFAPPQAGPSILAAGDGAGTSLGVSSRAPLKNSESPPFLFFFFFVAVGDEFLFFKSVSFNKLESIFFEIQVDDSRVVLLIVSSKMVLSPCQT